MDRNRGKENKARVGGDTNRILKRAKEMYFLCSTTHISLYFFTRYSIEYNWDKLHYLLDFSITQIISEV